MNCDEFRKRIKLSVGRCITYLNVVCSLPVRRSSIDNKSIQRHFSTKSARLIFQTCLHETTGDRSIDLASISGLSTTGKSRAWERGNHSSFPTPRVHHSPPDGWFSHSQALYLVGQWIAWPYEPAPGQLMDSHYRSAAKTDRKRTRLFTHWSILCTGDMLLCSDWWKIGSCICNLHWNGHRGSIRCKVFQRCHVNSRSAKKLVSWTVWMIRTVVSVHWQKDMGSRVKTVQNIIEKKTEIKRLSTDPRASKRYQLKPYTKYQEINQMVFRWFTNSREKHR